MKSATRVLSVTLFVVCSLPSPSQTPAAPQPGVSTGTKIGNAISAAISTAFPAVSSIINAIWKPGDNSKKSKTTAQDAAQPVQKAANQGLQDVDKITNDLDVVTTFLSNTIVAENNVIDMRAVLRGKTTLGADKLKIQNDFAMVKGRLTKLGGNDVATTINNVNDASIQTVLRAVASANSGTLDSINNDISAGDAGLADLVQQLETLDNQLSAVNALAGEIIGDVSLGLKTARQKASQGMGPVDTSAEDSASKVFKHTLEARFPALNNQ